MMNDMPFFVQNRQNNIAEIIILYKVKKGYCKITIKDL